MEHETDSNIQLALFYILQRRPRHSGAISELVLGPFMLPWMTDDDKKPLLE